MTPLRYSNRNGFPCLESIGATLTTSTLTYNFNRHPFVNNYFYGGFFVKLSSTPTAPETAVPVQFTTAGGNATAVLDKTGAAITTATIADGIYLAFYDRDNDKLQLLNV
jgi:hypothetical protein